MPKAPFRRALNRLLHLLARTFPGSGSVRPFLHRLRGVRCAGKISIADDVYIENEYPELVEIGENVMISIRSMIIAHSKGPGRVVIERGSFVGAGAMLICASGNTLRIGEGSVISAGCVITGSIPPRSFVVPQRPHIMAEVTIPYPTAASMGEFLSGLRVKGKSARSDSSAVKDGVPPRAVC